MATTTPSYHKTKFEIISSGRIYRTRSFHASKYSHFTISNNIDSLWKIQPALDNLEKLSLLPNNWDSYGAECPSTLAVENARSFLFKLPSYFPYLSPHEINPFTIVPVCDGGIQIEWRNQYAEIELEVESDGKFSYLLIDKSQKERVFLEKHGVVPSDIIKLLEKVFYH